MTIENGTTALELARGNGHQYEIMESVIATGDLSKLSADQRVRYYLETCQSLGLNPYTKPFDYLALSGKLTLYATRTATDQLRSAKRVSVQIVSREQVGDVYIVTARATTHDGRIDESTGAVTTGGLRGDALANALMKAETKAKRRVTLSICGLGWMDESELETVRDARRVESDYPTETTPRLPEPSVVKAQPPSRAGGITEAQRREIGRLYRSIGWPEQALQSAIQRFGVAKSADLSEQQAAALIREMQSTAPRVAPQPEPVAIEEPPVIDGELVALAEADDAEPDNLTLAFERALKGLEQAADADDLADVMAEIPHIAPHLDAARQEKLNVGIGAARVRLGVARPKRS